MAEARYPCPCCGYLTLPEPPPGTYEICEVCFWEDDAVQFDDPDYTGGANTVSLRQARDNYRALGVSEPRFKANVRAPRPEEQPEALRVYSRALARVTERHPGSRALAWLARMGDDLPELIVEDAAAWAAWLARRHATSDGVWLALAKRGGHPPTRLRYQEALEEALCYGWIDGQVRRRDADSYRQRFTPRRKRSAWSKRNVDLAERLIGEGRMKPPGKAAVEQARSDGRWQAAYAGSATIEMPDDLAEALAAEPKAAAMFALLTSQNRYAILYRLATAKRSDTRSRRLTKFVEMLARGETIYPQQRRPE